MRYMLFVCSDPDRTAELERLPSSDQDMSDRTESWVEEMDRRGKQVRPNVDFFSASVYRMLGFPAEMYTPIFTVARTPGWAAHLLEQYADNRLMRPKLAYEGEKGKTFVPIESR